MKLNWGTALVIFFAIYIGLLVRIVIKSKTVDHSLVVENYYQHDINYQKKLDKINNRSFLKEDLHITYSPKQNIVKLKFGENFDNIKNAKIEMYRASDKSLDFTQDLGKISGSLFELELPQLKQGRWKVKINWEDGQRAYFKEQDIYVHKA